MSLDDELDGILQAMEHYANQNREIDEKEAVLNAQIASLRLDIAKLRDARYEVRNKIKIAERDKESVERKLELQRESELITKNLEEKRKEAEEILATAPWKDTAFDWQIEGAMMLPDRAIIADKRGLGKTLSSLIWRRLHKSKKTLICVRKEVAADFMKEIYFREPGLFVYPLISATNEQRAIAAMLLKPQDEYIVITNIESWRRDVDKTTASILEIPFDGIILDEAHHIKNADTGTAKGFFELAEKVPKVLELTGTPIKNRPQEMYSLLHALYPAMFPRQTKFLYDFCVQSGQNKWIFSQTGLKTLVKMISAFYIARTPEDIGRKVPPPRMIEYKLDFNAHQQQAQAYKIMTERSLAVLQSGKAIPIVSQLAIMTRQAQVVSWPAGINFVDPETEEIIKFDVHESVKMDWAEDLLKELHGEEERTIVFSRFKPAIYELKRRLVEAGLSVAVITGDKHLANSTEEVFDDFDLKTAPKNPKFDVLLATYQTIGESANLNAARHMILYDRFWNPGNDDQAIGRIDRINSIDQATVHLPAVEGTIDDYMAQLIDEKRSIVMDFKDAASMQASLVSHLQKSL